MIFVFLEVATEYHYLLHAPGEMIIKLHNVQHKHELFVGGSLPKEVLEEVWTLALISLFGEPMSELQMKGMFTGESININYLFNLCGRT